MANTSAPVLSPQKGALSKWFKFAAGGSRKGASATSSVRIGDRLCSIEVEVSGEIMFVQAKISGEVEALCVAEGAQVNVGEVLARISPCAHPAMFNSMCVACGEKVTISASSVSSLTLGGGQQLHVSKQEAAKVQESKVVDLQRIKKLALILDLDHTLVHATEITGPPMRIEEGVSLLVLEEPSGASVGGAPPSASMKQHLLAKRPHLDWFLAEAHKICQLTIYTAATRRYAEAVAKIIDPTGKMFTGRMVSRSDIPNDKSGGLVKSLQRLFLGDSSMAVIIDDRYDVWQGEQENQLLLVKPFHFFKEGREINNVAGPSSAMGGGIDGGQSTQGALISLSGNSPGGYMANGEKDDQLIRCLHVLQALHSQYFDGMKQGTPVPIGRLLSTLKSKTLSGCVISFSGIIPTNEKVPQNHPLWRLAVSLGAQVTQSILPRTTHLISIYSQTQKVASCLQRGNIWVLHPDWLFYCRWAMVKVLETTFMITALAPGTDLPNPTLDTSAVFEDLVQQAASSARAARMHAENSVLEEEEEEEQEEGEEGEEEGNQHQLYASAPGSDASESDGRGTKRGFGAMSEERGAANGAALAGPDDDEDDDDDGFGAGFDDSI